MLLIFLTLLSIALLIITALLVKKVLGMRTEIRELKFSKTSQSVKYGKLTEQFIPFTQDFPFDPENFRFLGSPIDGVAFNENEIVFCEFKTATSRLSEKQKRFKQLVQNKMVKWFEFNLR